jgi:hypothetical protein
VRVELTVRYANLVKALGGVTLEADLGSMAPALIS